MNFTLLQSVLFLLLNRGSCSCFIYERSVALALQRLEVLSLPPPHVQDYVTQTAIEMHSSFER
jgi:hypothetical protein